MLLIPKLISKKISGGEKSGHGSRGKGVTTGMHCGDKSRRPVGYCRLPWPGNEEG